VRNPCRIWCGAAVVGIIVIVSMTTIFTARQTVVYKAARLKGTTKPDLNGLWQALNEGNWDIQAHAAQPGPPQFGALFAMPAGAGIVEGNEIPYQLWALSKKKENFENRLARSKLTNGNLGVFRK
jgi:hypothetical protein